MPQGLVCWPTSNPRRLELLPAAIATPQVHTAGEGVLEGTVRCVALEVAQREGIPVVLQAPKLQARPGCWGGTGCVWCIEPISIMFVGPQLQLSQLSSRTQPTPPHPLMVLFAGPGQLGGRLHQQHLPPGAPRG